MFEIYLIIYFHVMQYKKEVEVMLEVARSYIKSGTSDSKTDTTAPQSVAQDSS